MITRAQRSKGRGASKASRSAQRSGVKQAFQVTVPLAPLVAVPKGPYQPWGPVKPSQTWPRGIPTTTRPGLPGSSIGRSMMPLLRLAPPVLYGAALGALLAALYDRIEGELSPTTPFEEPVNGSPDEPSAAQGWQECGSCAGSPPTSWDGTYRFREYPYATPHPNTTTCGFADSCLGNQKYVDNQGQTGFPPFMILRGWNYTAFGAPAARVNKVWYRPYNGETDYALYGQPAVALAPAPTSPRPYIETIPEYGLPEAAPLPEWLPWRYPPAVPFMPAAPPVPIPEMPPLPRTTPRPGTRPGNRPQPFDPFKPWRETGPGNPRRVAPRDPFQQYRREARERARQRRRERERRAEPIPDVVLRPNDPPRLAPPSHKQAPPPPRKKDKKLYARSLGVVAKIFDAASEGNEFIDSLHRALPRKARKGKTPQGKLYDLYQNWNELDGQRAIRNLAIDQIEDAIIGRGIGKTKRMYRKGFKGGKWNAAGNLSGTKVSGTIRIPY